MEFTDFLPIISRWSLSAEFIQSKDLTLIEYDPTEEEHLMWLLIDTNIKKILVHGSKKAVILERFSYLKCRAFTLIRLLLNCKIIYVSAKKDQVFLVMEHGETEHEDFGFKLRKYAKDIHVKGKEVYVTFTMRYFFAFEGYCRVRGTPRDRDYEDEDDEE